MELERVIRECSYYNLLKTNQETVARVMLATKILLLYGFLELSL